jgi:hypothetical protein
MKKKLGPNSMSSSKGYAIRTLNRAELEYKTGENRLIIVREPGYKQVLILKIPVTIVYLSLIKTWDTPKKIISETEKMTIKQNVKEGLRFLGVKCVFE